MQKLAKSLETLIFIKFLSFNFKSTFFKSLNNKLLKIKHLAILGNLKTPYFRYIKIQITFLILHLITQHPIKFIIPSIIIFMEVYKTLYKDA